MKFSIACIVLLFVFCGWRPEINRNFKNQKKIIEQRVEVAFSINQTHFPQSWQKETVYMASLTDKGIQKNTLKIIAATLKKYPATIIKKNLKKIYVLDSICFKGADIGGTIYGDTIYIVNKYITNGWNDTLIEKRIHHEFSHILFNKYLVYFPANIWTTNNAREYGNGGLNAVLTNDYKMISSTFDHKMMLCGFLFPYAQSAMDEDFAAFAENIWCPTKRFCSVIDNYKKIKKKRELAINFYSKIDSGLNEDYFLKLIQNNMNH